MKKIIRATVLASVFLFIGCSGVSPLPSSAIAKMDFGPQPTNIKMENLKSAFYNFKDPYSVVVTELKTAAYPKRGYMLDVNGKLYWKGWVTLVNANAKNSYGGYIGNKPYFVAMKNGKGFLASTNVGDDALIYFVD